MNRHSARTEELLEAEIKRLRDELKKANLEKSEINCEYEKLTTICRSQRQQLQGLKQALASTTTSNQTSPGLLNKSCLSPDETSWQAFPENSRQNGSGSAVPATRSPVVVPATDLSRFGGLKNNERNLTSQPPGWAAF